MATPKTMYQRNKGKVDRPMLALQQQFNQARDQYNKDYTSALGDYQTKLSAYEQQSKTYESKFSEYKQRADAYNTAVAKYNEKTPFNYRVTKLYGSNSFYMPDLANEKWGSGRAASARQQMLAFGLSPLTGGPYDTRFWDPGASYSFDADQFGGAAESGKISKRGGPDPGVFKETFNEPAPAAPAEPDTAAAKTKLAEAETTYNREVAERKAGKVRARMRTTGRSMLSSAALT